MARFLKAGVQAQQLNYRKTPLPWKPRFLEVSKEPSIPFPLKERFQPKRVNLAYHLGLKEGDLVKVLYGKDQGKEGIILKIDGRKNTLLVEGCNLQRKALRVGNTGNSSFMLIELPIHVTNVAILDPVLKLPTRVKKRLMLNGENVRISKISGCAIPKSVSKPLLPSSRDLLNAHSAFLSKGAPIKEQYANVDRNEFNLLKQISSKMLMT
ncbi:putative 50S ribosomal protein l24 [Cardiosporidium cionae]|uniref:Large ribosomal subunit protein uL24c n=1 Tax=Cardiosporidium cionae TaxID=476202 RepID=A0ABQ7JDQ3_9APIC|nr:putative 50S ribosomal protein l24 [Cardiosporidium cionae]|eukprot:KAF8822101.1 putative 50S ribosomal protein l24 [Cardiosporidium cionae]